LAEIYNAAVLGVRDYYHKSKCFTGAVLGLSGGLDSALVLAIAADALGAENVHPVSLPSKYTADISNSLAQKMCDNLGIKMDTISIEPMVKTFSEHLTLTGVAAENVQARIRGNIRMGLSNQNNWLLLSTGNKSEMAVGYATLYGDMAGGFNPLKDIYKTVAFDLCRWRNARGDGEIIPVGIINRPPSAELAPDQRDTDSLPDYPILDGILECIVEKQMAIDEIPYDTATVKRVYKMLARAEYKRRQAAPGVKITERALRGNDRRVPMVNGFQI
jgi:NAD+ synthase (glutamine-hydrolysing)